MVARLDVERLKQQVEKAMEMLLRAADERVCWKQSDDDSAPQLHHKAKYTLLPGVYRTLPHESGIDQPQIGATHTSDSHEGDGSSIRLLLHGDNSFEYVWTLKRTTPRAMEHLVEIVGTWHKAVLNRTRRGEHDQRIFLTAHKIRFQRLSNFDSETQTWKLCLKTLTRHGSDWASVGETERGVPPIVIILECVDGGLVSTGAAATAAQILTNSPACRILAGLTKKVANKLGAPIDVMTDQWLPTRQIKLTLLQDDAGNFSQVKKFNPFFCLAEALKSCSLQE